MRKGWLAAAGIGLLVVALYIAILGVLDSTGHRVKDEAVGYGIAVFLATAGGSWLILASRGGGDGPR